MDAARILTEARQRSGLSQTDLGHRAGIPRETVGRIEAGTQVPRVDTLDALLEACGAELILTRRLGMGVDRESIRKVLRLDVAFRIGPRARFAIRVLAARHVRGVLIGPVAERIHGCAEPVESVDVCIQGDRLNRLRMEKALGVFSRPLTRAAPVRWRLRPPPPFRTYEDLVAGVDTIALDGRRVLVASLNDLVRIRLAGRTPHHLERAEVLGAVREEQARLATGYSGPLPADRTPAPGRARGWARSGA